MRTALQFLRYAALTLGGAGLIALCAGPLVSAAVGLIPSENATPRVSPLIQSWLDRIEDEAAHEKKLRAAEAAAKAAAEKRMARHIPVVARGETQDEIQPRRRPAESFARPSRRRELLAARPAGRADRLSAAPRIEVALPWRERPSL